MGGAAIIIGILILAALAVLIFLQLRKNNSPAGDDNSTKLLLELNENLRKEIQDIRKEVQESGGKNREEMLNRLDAITKNITEFQGQTSKGLHSQFKETKDIIRQVTEKLTQLQGTNQQVLGFAEQMRSLENILQNPKQRGVLGEYFLETVLGNVLPPGQYKMQYSFANGETVDAAIFYRDSIIPIDAKFSLSSYNEMVQTDDPDQREALEKQFKKDLKDRIDETSKYIRPQERTTDFAFMFIPAEGIYYNLLIYNVGTVQVNTKDLIEYAFGKRVIIVSPTSFYAYLETVLQGMKALRIEEGVKEIQKRIGDLGRHLKAYESYMQKLGNNLGTTVNMYNSASKEFRKIDKDVMKITNGEAGGEFNPLLLDKPQQDEE